MCLRLQLCGLRLCLRGRRTINPRPVGNAAYSRCRMQAAWTLPLRKFLLDLLPDAPHPLRVLEVGCGEGAVLRHLKQETDRNLFCFGLDINHSALSRFSGEGQSCLLTAGNGARLPFPADCFDFVFCHYLLLWVEDPAGVLGEMRRVCRKGGLCAAMAEPVYSEMQAEPAAMYQLADLQRIALTAQGIDPSAGRKLRGWFESAGFERVHVSDFQAVPLSGKALEAEIRQMETDAGCKSAFEMTPDASFFVPTSFAYARV